MTAGVHDFRIEYADPLRPLPWVYDDGGREAAGYKGPAGDCVCRSIAVATGQPYQEVYAALQALLAGRSGARSQGSSRTPRDGYPNKLGTKYMESIGWQWTPTMGIGTGCKVHMRGSELPRGRIIVRLTRHWAAVIDGVLHDTYDCTRKGKRCVYGYWRKQEAMDAV